MNPILDLPEIQSHQSQSKETLLFCISNMFQRAAYYGVRSAVLLYMTSEILKMDNEDAFSIFGWFVSVLLFSKVIGAILGDLIIGNKKSIILGAILQTIGSLCLCVHSMTGLYVGLALVFLGCSLYSPNLKANLGKSLLSNKKLLDSSFTLLYLGANLGAFWGIILIGIIGEKYNWNTAFILSGVLMILSIIPILFTKKVDFEAESSNHLAINKRVYNILIAFIFTGIFWAIYEISNIRFSYIEPELREIVINTIPNPYWSLVNSILLISISLLAFIYWRYYYSSQFTKLALGFIFATISFGILFTIPDIPTEQHLILYFISLFFFSLAETHIAPVIHSTLTEYANPKYLAIFISLAFLPTKLLALLVGLFNEGLLENSALAIRVSLFSMLVLGLILVVIFILTKNRNNIAKNSDR